MSEDRLGGRRVIRLGGWRSLEEGGGKEGFRERVRGSRRGMRGTDDGEDDDDIPTVRY